MRQIVPLGGRNGTGYSNVDADKCVPSDYDVIFLEQLLPFDAV
jgi:hypothetical protein